MPVNKVLPALLLVVVAVRLPRVVCQCDAPKAIVDASYSMAVGEEVRIVVHSHGQYGWISIGLCSPQSCSSVTVGDYRSNNNTLEFQIIHSRLNSVQINDEVKKKFRSSITGLNEGQNYTFIMRRANTKSFDFWMESERSFRLSVDTKPDELKLKLDTSVGDIYTIPVAARGDHVLAEGEEIGLVVKTSRISKSGVSIGLCGPSSCDSVQVDYISDEPQPRLNYRLYLSKSNTIYTRRDSIAPSQGPKGQFPSNKNYTFMIRRRMGAIDVWLDGYTDSKVSFASNNDILRVTSWVGSTHFIQGRKEEVRKRFGGTCGRARTGTEALVVNGRKSSIDKVPWHAGIYLKENGVWKGVCGGTLVAPSTIVTAAHCVATSLGQAKPPAQFSVALGKTYSSWDSEGTDHTIQKFQVKKIHVHTWYRGDKTKLANDIAVLELSACAKLGDKIFPVCVDRAFQGDEMKPLKVPGWGNGSSLLTELESVEMPFMTTEGCRDFLDSNLNEYAYITDDKLCSYHNSTQAGSQGVITGDSGSGAVFQFGGLWYLQGIVSGKMSVVKKGVNVDVYTFTNVIHHLDWLSLFMSW